MQMMSKNLIGHNNSDGKISTFSIVSAICIVSIALNIFQYYLYNSIPEKAVEIESVSNIEVAENSNAISDELEGSGSLIGIQDIEKDTTDRDFPSIKDEKTGEKPLQNNTTMVNVRSGDTLFGILTDSGVSPTDVYKINRAITQKIRKYRLNINDIVTVKFISSPFDQVLPYYSKPSIVIVDSGKRRIEVVYNANMGKYIAKIVSVPMTQKHSFLHGKITDEGGLYQAAENAGVDKNVIMNLIQIFRHSIDFQRDLRKDDTFSVLYDYYVNEDKKGIHRPTILYAAISISGVQKEIYSYTKNNVTNYYYVDGTSIQTALLKTPVRAVISSGFGMRYHPIHGFNRMHKGIDFAAARGTPVLSAGGGVIQSAYRSASFGNVVKIKHSPQYGTLYAHMDRFAENIAVGNRIKQGQVIGYVGDTGAVSGVHLHYEVHHNGVPIDPAKATFTKLSPLSNQDLIEFKKQKEYINTLKKKNDR